MFSEDFFTNVVLQLWVAIQQLILLWEKVLPYLQIAKSNIPTIFYKEGLVKVVSKTLEKTRGT